MREQHKVQPENSIPQWLKQARNVRWYLSVCFIWCAAVMLRSPRKRLCEKVSCDTKILAIGSYRWVLCHVDTTPISNISLTFPVQIWKKNNVCFHVSHKVGAWIWRKTMNHHRSCRCPRWKHAWSQQYQHLYLSGFCALLWGRDGPPNCRKWGDPHTISSPKLKKLNMIDISIEYRL